MITFSRLFPRPDGPPHCVWLIRSRGTAQNTIVYRGMGEYMGYEHRRVAPAKIAAMENRVFANADDKFWMKLPKLRWWIESAVSW